MPVAVPITMPSTSPIAQPVRQCSVAVAAIAQVAFMAVNYTPGGYQRQGVTGLDFATAGRARAGGPGRAARRRYPLERGLTGYGRSDGTAAEGACPVRTSAKAAQFTESVIR